MGMRHVRILSLFISSILPTQSPFIQTQRKGLRTCLHCGKFQLYNNNKKNGIMSMVAQQQQSSVRYYSSETLNNNNIPNSNKKYTSAHIHSRPAEPSIAIHKLSSQGRPTEALSIYLKLLSEGGFPSREALYQLTRALYKSDNLLGMYAIHDTLISYYNHNLPSKRNSRAMIYMYTMLINLITKSTKPVDMNTILNLCKEMKQFNEKSTDSIVLYNTLLKTLLQQNQVLQAQALLHELKRQNIQPTIITFGILMKDASRRKDIESMMNYLDEIEQQPNISPDYAIVSILITTLCDAHEFDRAKDMVEKLHKTVKADDLVGAKYRQQLLKTIDQRRKKSRKKLNKDLV